MKNASLLAAGQHPIKLWEQPHNFINPPELMASLAVLASPFAPEFYQVHYGTSSKP
ncbi:hypothetical protein EMIT0P260_50175 [Pseudomonas sp. IT-P260]